MTRAEDAIRRALSPEDLRAYDALAGDQSPIEAALEAFRTQHRMFAIGSWMGGVLLFLAFLYAAWRFAHTPDVRGMLAWGGGAAFAMFSLGLLKLWFWMEMQKNVVVREVKRLEFQVASLVTLVARP